MNRLLSIFTIFALCSLGVPLALADAPAAESAGAVSPADAAKAEAFIKNKHDKVRGVLRKPDTPKRAEELTELLGEFLDYGVDRGRRESEIVGAIDQEETPAADHDRLFDEP